MQPDHFRRLFDYDADSNRNVLAVARGVFAPDERPARILSHLITSLELWLLRLRGEYLGSEPFWNDAEWDRLARQIERNWRDVHDYLDESTPQTLARPIAYKNSRGEAYESRPADILQHVIIHGGYHRGQVALALRERGIDPPVTDFIRWVRE